MDKMIIFLAVQLSQVIASLRGARRFAKQSGEATKQSLGLLRSLWPLAMTARRCLPRTELLQIFTALGLILLFVPYGRAQEARKAVIEDISFDKEAKTISYTVNHPAYIRIRLGIEEGPLYQTLVNWEKREKGSHKEAYSGLENEKTVFTLNYFTEDDSDRYGLQIGEILPHPEQLAIGKTLPTAWLNQMHKDDKRENCYDPKINIYLKGAKARKGITVVKKAAPLIIEIDKKDKVWFTNERFQVHIFLDNVLVHAELGGYTPYAWNFSPEKLNKGSHTITVNLSGFNDHMAAAALPIIIEG